MRSIFSGALVALGFLALVPACTADGIGDPCVPEDEYSPTFSGFSVTEVNTESRSFSCQTRLCLINRFQGRVSCPYGQEQGATGAGHCTVPGSDEPISARVSPQLLDRRPELAVYCSCRCDGPDPKARYCECPSGYSCSPAVPDLSLGSAQLPGSYCLREGSVYDEGRVREKAVCNRAAANCEDGS